MVLSKIDIPEGSDTRGKVSAMHSPDIKLAMSCTVKAHSTGCR